MVNSHTDIEDVSVQHVKLFSISITEIVISGNILIFVYRMGEKVLSNSSERKLFS